jgi:hypothetical protein
MKTKILSLLILSIALISCASATLVVKGYFLNDVHDVSETITAGESITLKAIFTSVDSITQKDVQLPTGVNSDGGTCTASNSGYTYTCIYSISSNTEGTYSIRVIGKDSAGRVDSDDLILAVKPKITPIDTTKPVITILGSNPVTIYVDHTYTDAGATAYDNVDGDISSKIYTSNSVNIHTIGNYYVSYTVSDLAGNTASATRTVKVIANPNPTDTIKPVITLIGSASVNVYLNHAYTDAGATAYDNIDGDISSRINVVNSVNTNVLGSYSVTYTVSDNAGNAATPVIRHVYVIANPNPTDTTKPIITLNGNTNVNIYVGNSYTELGATASDNVDGDISSKIIVTGSVNTNAIGSYDIYYNVKDNAGNAAIQVVRYVHVIANPTPTENHAPIIESISNQKINENTHYTYQVEASDQDVGDSLSYDLTGPSWLSIDSNGLISGKAPFVTGNEKEHIIVTVSDGDYVVSEDYYLTVKDSGSSSSGCSGYTVTDYPSTTNTEIDTSTKGYGSVIATGTSKKQSDLIWFYLLLGVLGLGTLITGYALIRKIAKRY